ncbi:eCIS core domain-containing protein [Roseobacter sp. A03A-229]
MAQTFAPGRNAVKTSATPKADRRPPQAGNAASARLGALQMRADQSAPVQRLARWTGRGVAQRAPADEQTSGGLPSNLKSGMEAMSGMDLSDVKVHRNSSQPAQVGAHAYAQGTDIHLAAGQEKHLPHEAWHAVQQKQGRVKPTRQLKGAVDINDDAGLEAEADVMGAKASRAAAQMVSDSKDA